VIGDLIVDYWFYGQGKRETQEYGKSTTIVDIEKKTCTLGGAGNVARHLKSLGAQVDCIGLVGEDFYGQHILSNLFSERQIYFHPITEVARLTSVKTRLVETERNTFIRFDIESREPLTMHSETTLKQLLSRLSFDAIVVSDYCKGMITPHSFKLIQLSSQDKPIFVDPKQRLSTYNGAYALKLNYDETSVLQILYARKNFPLNVVTKAERGLSVLTHHADISLDPIQVPVKDAIGCGDATLAGLTLAALSKTSEYNIGCISNIAGATAASFQGTTFDLTWEALKKTESLMK
jgi:D-beta-D-heptose 7-phosphate kinase/D-beta-D-heptose 1-phosphate adenosyltransferase